MTGTNGCQVFRLYCKRRGPCGEYCVTVQHGKLSLTRPSSADSNQLWYKDTSDKAGVMLVHQATGMVVKYSSAGVQLQLVKKPCGTDKSTLWSESADVGSGYKFLRTLSDGNYVIDAWTGNINEGTILSTHANRIYDANTNVENQLWKLAA